ncbi:MAG: FHA domain-containing protein [Dehalococcoidia bacterium]|nr:FHA domain-containing protein [Dehalococcoidia bacterium]
MPDNDIVLSDPRASRYHCTVMASGSDARSARNGILMGGRRVHHASLLDGQGFSKGEKMQLNDGGSFREGTHPGTA